MNLNRRAVATVAIAALTGANIAQAWVILGAYWWSDQLPQSGLFRAVLYALWLPLGAVAAASGLLAAFRLAAARGNARVPLLVFLLLLSWQVKVDGYELGWSFLRLGLNFAFDRVAIGVNVVGLALLGWLYHTGGLRAANAAQDAALTDDSPPGRNAA